MSIPDQILLSDFLSYSVRCDQGIDHGNGIMAWMHPPVHRLLGWVTRPSVIKLSREVWSLKNLRALNNNMIFVKSSPEISIQSTLDRLPTLLEAYLLDINNIKIAIIADFVFEPRTGKILYYLVSRTDPRIPGTSRWKLSIDRIVDQEPGLVSTSIESLDDLPLVKSSIRQDFIKKSRNFRDQLQVLTDKATDRLEGWLEESSLEKENISYEASSDYSAETESFDDWIDEFDEESQKSRVPFRKSTQYSNTMDEEDPWV